MSRNIQGVVEVVAQRGKAYNVKIGNDWFGYGFSAPSFKKGDNVAFTTVLNGKFENVDVNTVEILSAAPTAAAPAGGGSGGGGKDAYWADKEKRDDGRQAVIIYQSARNAAIDTIELAYNLGALSFPAKVKASEKLDVLREQIEAVTNSYYDNAVSIGNGSGAFTDELNYLGGTAVAINVADVDNNEE